MHDTLSHSPDGIPGKTSIFAPCDTFPRRHLGSNAGEVSKMLESLGFQSMDALIDSAVPAKLRLSGSLDLPAGLGECETLAELRAIASKNRVFKSYIGQGYNDCIVPPVIQRNILENPGWYTAYTPYQAEISQGRMEALINFQQMVIDLTGLDIANASLLDEATAAAEAMHMAHAVNKDGDARAIFVSERCHPQTIAVVRTRAEPLGIEVVVCDEAKFDFKQKKAFAVLLQYPDTTGRICDYRSLIEQAHTAGALAIVAADILALTLLRAPGEFGADIAVGSTQRFGVPMGFGGPHAAYMAVKDAFKRLMPGRLVGVSKDAHGLPAYRLSLQTREQHIRRDKATSNICTAQVLLAVMASMYAVYHGPEGLKAIAQRVHGLAKAFAVGVRAKGFSVLSGEFFDTVGVKCGSTATRDAIFKLGLLRGINLRPYADDALLVAFDETVTVADFSALTGVFTPGEPPGAFDFIRKETLPFNLNVVVDAALKAQAEMKAATTSEPQITVEGRQDSIVGKSTAMQQVFKMVGRVSHSDAPVMITGESGSGKELVARAIHHYSQRSSKGFVAINCAAIPEQLLESELFGHEKGAFTGATGARVGRFEQSNGGSLFLDEIGDMPLALQGKILRVLQEGEFSRVGGNESLKTDVRIIAATSKNLEEEVSKRSFREDLFHRLNVVRIQLPPLRQRTEDIRLLAEYFLQKVAIQKHLPRLKISEEAVRVLEAYAWPGNVRELANTIQRACVLATSDLLTPKDIPLGSTGVMGIPELHARTSEFLTHPVFNKHHTEHEMLRYIRRLEARDLSLTTSMIPLGSCTMKLNATSEMLPVTWPEFGKLHPFAPAEQAAGYAELCEQLSAWLAAITGFAAISLEPNAGSQGEYAGLLVIRKYHLSRGEGHRDICLIPTSAHGTNFASAVMAGMKVVTVACLEDGDIDLTDLRAKADAHKDRLAALMVTYPSTHGVFEETIGEICELIHERGGQVYMDGANMNAQVGLMAPGRIGADVCHLNLHKTFCIPHGGGGPGMGPIGVAAHLSPFLSRDGSNPASIGPVSAAPFGSASILTIPWVYIRMMGGEGLTDATRIAILNANYVARRLDPYFPVLYKGRHGLVAHECIIDIRGFHKTTAEDVAKRLMDYGFHAPTLSWPVPGTLMIEPTESESKEELDRFCEALISIHGEMTAVENGAADAKDNPLKNAPHTALSVMAGEWTRPYSRETAAFPAPWLREHKFWPSVGRIDNVWGDRNLFCSCVPLGE